VPLCRHTTAPTVTSRTAAQAPRAVPTREVNERYRQHPAPGSFTVESEGQITRWDTFAAQGPPFPRHTRRSVTSGSGATG